VAEPELGPLFRGADADLPRLDVDVILERSRRRRAGRVVAMRSVLAVVIIGALGSGAYGLGHLGGSVGNGASSAATGSSEPVAGVACTGPTPATDNNAGGLVARVQFRTMHVGQASAHGTMTLTNSGSSTISGTAGEPTVALSKNGAVLWRTTSSDSAGILVHLKPGASMTVDAYVQSGACAPAGRYEVTASMSVDVGDGTILNVTSSPSEFVIRP
jgi:hypothetical protein